MKSTDAEASVQKYFPAYRVIYQRGFGIFGKDFEALHVISGNRVIITQIKKGPRNERTPSQIAAER